VAQFDVIISHTHKLMLTDVFTPGVFGRADRRTCWPYMVEFVYSGERLGGTGLDGTRADVLAEGSCTSCWQ